MVRFRPDSGLLSTHLLPDDPGEQVQEGRRQTGRSRLLAGPEARAVAAVEILVEQDEIAIAGTMSCLRRARVNLLRYDASDTTSRVKGERRHPPDAPELELLDLLRLAATRRIRSFGKRESVSNRSLHGDRALPVTLD